MTTKSRNKIKLAILGWGREGKSLVAYARRRWGQGAVITVLDKNKKLADKIGGISFEIGPDYLKNLSRFDIIFRSPGIPFLNKGIQQAQRAGTLITSATELFFEEIQSQKLRTGSRFPILIGVTGTKGKGTTATLIHEILKRSGKKALLAGNIGTPMLSELQKSKQMEYVVLELSSFQLQDLQYSPAVAVILDVTPDHLDIHRGFGEYARAKSNIARFQQKSDTVFYFPGNPASAAIAKLSKGAQKAVSRTRSPLFKQEELRIIGSHGFQNANMAATVAASLGCPKSVIRKTILNFKGIEHRLELVRVLSLKGKAQKAKVYFYNDSAGTNPETAVAAVRSFATPTVLIAGGKDKGLDYAPLAKALKGSSCRAVILFGENKLKIRRQIAPAKIPNGLATTLPYAISKAFHTASIIARKAEKVAVIFSPASASFDMFSDYQERGRQFKKTVKNIK